MTQSDFPSRVRVLAVGSGVVTIGPAGTNYEMQLALADGTAADKLHVGKLVEGVIRVTSRKIWTVPSGGNFISPIFGPPRTIQGRIRAIQGNKMTVHAATPIEVQVSADAETLDLTNGPLVVGAMVNVTAMPGGTFEVLQKSDGSGRVSGGATSLNDSSGALAGQQK